MIENETEDSPFTNSCLFTLDRLPLLVLLRRNFSSLKTSQQSVRKTYPPLLVFYISLSETYKKWGKRRRQLYTKMFFNRPKKHSTNVECTESLYIRLLPCRLPFLKQCVCTQNKEHNLFNQTLLLKWMLQFNPVLRRHWQNL